VKLATAFHSTSHAEEIRREGEVRPIRMDSVYLFSNRTDASDYAREFNAPEVLNVRYELGDVLRKWKPSYARRGQVIRLKPGCTAHVHRNNSYS
jgi:hypothetical protein